LGISGDLNLLPAAQMASIARKPAPRHAKPAQRHFAKKAPTDARGIDESSEEEQEQEIIDEEQGLEIGAFGDEADAQSFTSPVKVAERGTRPVKVALGNVLVEDGRVIVDGQVESGKTIVEQRKSPFSIHIHDQRAISGEEDESSESESEEEEEDVRHTFGIDYGCLMFHQSSEEESESEEEAAPKPQLRPVFVQK
jgi:microfibrillar-associated protein 1